MIEGILLTGIVGPMFSGKTGELLRQVDRAEHAELNVQVFKPVIDNRWEKTQYVVSHNGHEHHAIPVSSSLGILNLLEPYTQMVAIDEIQFMDKNIIPVVEELVERGIEVVFAGLPLDFRGEPFGDIPYLLAKAGNIVSLSAICKYKENGSEKICGKEATRTQRLVNGEPAKYEDPIIMIGAAESYTARCIPHHQVPGKPSRNLR